jgi:hypothetical protein
MIISTVDVISPTEAFVFGVGPVPLEAIKEKMFRFGNVSIVDILAAKKDGSNKNTVM